MRPRRQLAGTQMAFLDVMACGLGAAVLLFLIVKHNTGAAVEDDPAPRIAAAAATLEALHGEAERLAAEEEVQRKREEARRKGVKAQERLAAVEKDIAVAKVVNRALREAIEATPVPAPKPAAPVRKATPDKGRYLLGMKVEGERIAVLLDRSASMTDEKLLDIVRRKIRSDADRKKGPKWRWTVGIANWILERLPQESRFAVVAFNDRAKTLGQAGWSSGAAAVGNVMAEIGKLVPTGATNLEAGLRALKRLDPPPTDIYLVTDGLPTQNVSGSGGLLSLPGRIVPGLGSSSGCAARSRSRVSGECRSKLFAASLRATPSSATVNVILLPLEGDPDAAPSFWVWASSTDGLLMTPARGWP